MGQPGGATVPGHQGVSNQALCSGHKTTLGYFFCMVMVSVTMILFFHVAHSLGFLEGIAKTRADFTSGLQSRLNMVSDQEIDRNFQHARQNTRSLNFTGVSSGSIAPAPEVPNLKGSFEMDNFTSDSTTKKKGLKAGKLSSEEGECDLYTGKWLPDQTGPLYKNDTCPILSQPQNCQGNGRPDSGYENWRWKPTGCLLPRFDAEAFLQLMQGKVIAFVGDSIARNHMESLMCCLMQVETPKNRGYRKMQRWYFPLHSATIIRIWSAWLVNISREVLEATPADVTSLHLDQADEAFMEFLPKFDVLIISSGHWYPKKTAYILEGKVVGGQGWWKNTSSFKYNSSAAFAIAMRTALDAIVSHPEYHGLTIFRTYSPDHYEGGQWNSGGSCTGKTAPFTDAELPYYAYTELMRQHQLKAFQRAKLIVTNESKLRLMDVTPVFSYRADGHPGPYRNQDPNKQTKRGPNGHPPPQDCLHWCMPGPIDTWNDFLFEILKQELL